MSLVDQFESFSRSAEKEVYAFEEIRIGKVLVVTDLDQAEADRFLKKIRSFG